MALCRGGGLLYEERGWFDCCSENSSQTRTVKEGGCMALRLITVERAPNPNTAKSLLQAHAYWLSLCSEGSTPYRRDFKPTAIPGLLPSICLIDVLNGPRDFRFRLVGTAFRDVSGQELTGRLIGEVFPPEFRQEVFDGWNAIVENGGPNWASGRLWLKEREFLNWQGVALPLRAPSGETDQLLGAAAFSGRG